MRARNDSAMLLIFAAHSNCVPPYFGVLMILAIPRITVGIPSAKAIERRIRLALGIAQIHSPIPFAAKKPTNNVQNANLVPDIFPPSASQITAKDSPAAQSIITHANPWISFSEIIRVSYVSAETSDRFSRGGGDTGMRDDNAVSCTLVQTGRSLCHTKSSGDSVPEETNSRISISEIGPTAVSPCW